MISFGEKFVHISKSIQIGPSNFDIKWSHYLREYFIWPCRINQVEE